jgi:accessory gene regulator B
VRFIHALSFKSANYMMKQLNETHEKRRVYYYGFQVVIGGIVKGLLLILLALLTGTIVPALMIVVFFSSLRSLAGGYHMDTYGKCILVSLFMFLASAAVARYTYSMWNIYVIAIFAVVSFLVTIFSLAKWAPADNPNRPITKEEEIRKFRVFSFVYMVIWAVATIIFIWYDLKMYALCTCFAINIEAFIISPLGYKFFDFVKDGLSLQKKVCSK